MVSDTASASCPDWQPPKVPSIEEALSSDLCKGTPFEQRVEALKRATPELDANAQARRGSFRLLRFGPHGECMPAYPKAFEATCALIPKTTPAEHEKDYHSAFAPLWNDIRDRGAEVHCATVIGALIAEYVGRFNRTLVQHSRYPNKDLCRHIPFSGDWQTSGKSRRPAAGSMRSPRWRKSLQVSMGFPRLHASAMSRP